ncbi:MAG: tRNA pseudouridine(38-40) synthase TruA [Clostridia bacterium]|nr:tRNA pseudouridine(38-40) synthase TruA [Clostridia bacterium]
MTEHTNNTGRLALKIMYDGTKYCGWQVQKNAVSVQSRMQDALENLLGFRPDVSGVSRTDSGVHANNYVCHISAENVGIPAERFANALNARLHGSGIAVKSAVLVDGNFHARYSCIKKEYVYKIWNAPYMNPFYEGKAMFFPYKIDETRLTFLESELVGSHDFTAFMSKGSKITDDTVRTVDYFKYEREGDLLSIYVCADGFLYNMVRIMAGTFIAAHQGRIKPGDVTKALADRNRGAVGDTAPAEGLYLNRIWYAEPYNKLL